MSIKNAADLVRSQGRYGDTALMHVSPQEVAALQTIAQKNGRSLSVNPETGLPEAFDLGAMLPTLAGTAIGTAFGMPFLGAAIGGAGTYATTGSLEKGLMAGLGAFGGASFAGSLGAAGATGSALPAASSIPATAAQTTIGGAAIPAATSGGLPTMTAAGALTDAGAAQFMGAPLSQAGFAGLPASQKLSAVGSGFGNLMSNPADTFAQMGGLAGQGKNLAMMAAPIMGGTFMGDQQTTGEPEQEGDIRQMDYDPIGRRFVRRPVVSAKDFGGMQPSVFKYAEGGAVSRDDQIQKLYQETVGRPAGPSDLAIWNRGSNRGLSVDKIASLMKTAPEAVNYAQSQSDSGVRGARPELEPGIEDANRSQIARFYREYFNREPDEAGLDYFATEAAFGTPMQDIMGQIKSSAEGADIQQRAQLESFYRDYLGRTPDAQGAEYFRQEAQKGTSMEDIQRAIRGSEEASGIRQVAQQRQAMRNPMPQQGTPQGMAQQGAAPDQIDALYASALGRAPDAGGRAYFEDAIKAGAKPADIQQAMKASGEGAQFIGQSMIPNRYQQPMNVASPGVQDYNQLLANRANYEYVGMPQLDASRPRTPAEMQNIRDQNLLGQEMRRQDIVRGGETAKVNSEVASSNAMSGSQDRDIYHDYNYGEGYAGGGITDIPKFQAGGDMESDAFVVPADVVSGLGDGSTKAGLERLNQFLGIALPIEGEGTGLSDDIPATIEGEQPARVADGEAYIPPEVVARLGGGDPERGAAMLYTMMDKIREAAHGKTTQQGEVNPEQVMPA